MPGTPRRALLAALVALLALLIAYWFDSGVLADAQKRAGYTFDMGWFMELAGVAHIVTAAGVVAIALTCWRSRSLVVGIGYVVVGGFLVFLPALTWTIGVSVNGAPPLVPQPIASTLGQWYSTLATGVTGAFYTLAAAMFLSGLAVVGTVLLTKRGRASAVASTAEQAPQSEPA
jgi:hypothetical protein